MSATEADAMRADLRGADGGRLVAFGLAHRAPNARGEFLRDVIRHATAGLAILEGGEAAAENAYRLADAVAARL